MFCDSKKIFLFLLFFLSPSLLFSSEPIAEYWKAPVIGVWEGVAYSDKFYASKKRVLSPKDPRVQNYKVTFQFDSEKRVVNGKYKAVFRTSSLVVREVLEGKFHGSYEMYTDGKIDIKVTAFYNDNKQYVDKKGNEYIFPIKISGKVEKGGKKILGRGSLNAMLAYQGTILGYIRLERKGF